MANFPNLFVNGGFEHGDITGWSSSSSAVNAGTTSPHTGTYCGVGGDWCDLRQNVNCWANTNYTVSYWVKAVISGLFVNFNVSPISGAVFYTSPTSALTVGTWINVTATFNSGANHQISIDFFLTADSGPGPTMYYDDLAIYPAATVGTTWSPASNPWTLIFSDDFVDSSHIDSTASGNDGYYWYPQQFFGGTTNPSSYWAVSASEIQINNSTNNFGSTLQTARPGPGGVGYLGTVFNGGKSGGGIYFEARIRFLNIASIGANGWPAFWLDCQALGYQSMPGNPGYGEAEEMDIMEFNPTWNAGDQTQYSFTLHDWTSPGGSYATGQSCYMPAGNIPTNFHTYGMVWMPATAAGNWVGYTQSFFDGVAGPSVCWLGNQNYTGVLPPTWDAMQAQGYIGTQMDNYWLMLIMGGSQGGTPTIGFDYVKVWAATPANSMKVITMGGGAGGSSNLAPLEYLYPLLRRRLH